MIRFTGKFSVPKIDRDKFERALYARAEDLIIGSATAFVKKAYGHIPVDTGMARGSLVPLGRFLGVTIPIRSKRTRPAPPYIKSKEEGIKQGYQEVAADYRTQTVYFLWRSWVFHYYLNEQFNIRQVDSSPWYSIPIGLSAAIAHVRHYYRDALPIMSTHLRWKTQTLG